MLANPDSKKCTTLLRLDAGPGKFFFKFWSQESGPGSFFLKPWSQETGLQIPLDSTCRRRGRRRARGGLARSLKRLVITGGANPPLTTISAPRYSSRPTFPIPSTFGCANGAPNSVSRHFVIKFLLRLIYPPLFDVIRFKWTQVVHCRHLGPNSGTGVANGHCACRAELWRPLST